jgi:hypothetical protein
MSGMNCVRAEDAASLKGKILKYLLLDKMSTLEPVIKVDGKRRIEVGFTQSRLGYCAH